MDTSETYIKMCDCKEVQGWKMFKYNTIPQSPNCQDFVSLNYVAPNTWENIVWLPRQDQIQEMMSHIKPHYLPVTLVTFMQNQQRFYKNGKVKRLYPIGSMEQLWLAFYMYEKHQKFWEKDQWKKK